MPGKARRITGCNIFALLRSHKGNASAKSCYALPSRKANIFCLLSPEAFRLTIGDKTEISVLVVNKKEQWPVSPRGREYGLRGGSDWADLIFWLLLDQSQK
ncbi:hypothetical protein [Mucilaginibacter sp.]|uniref:hypothetical protein n=1 Tax=Mucilaginibacter sp. TaxID=1882438 RepID=UPI002614B067|nr:hypothetical protein [Mucilaginibacter sp.]